MSNPYNLTDKQLRFADYYFTSNDLKGSLTHAGYSLKNITEAKKYTLKHPGVKEYLDSRASALLKDNQIDLVAFVHNLDKADKIALETYKAWEAIDDPKNATKYKYWELLCKLKGHLSERNAPNFNISVDNRTLNHYEIADTASKIMQKLHKLANHKSDQNVIINQDNDL